MHSTSGGLSLRQHESVDARDGFKGIESPPLTEMFADFDLDARERHRRELAYFFLTDRMFQNVHNLKKKNQNFELD